MDTRHLTTGYTSAKYKPPTPAFVSNADHQAYASLPLGQSPAQLHDFAKSHMGKFSTSGPIDTRVPISAAERPKGHVYTGAAALGLEYARWLESQIAAKKFAEERRKRYLSSYDTVVKYEDERGRPLMFGQAMPMGTDQHLTRDSYALDHMTAGVAAPQGHSSMIVSRQVDPVTKKIGDYSDGSRVLSHGWEVDESDPGIDQYVATRPVQNRGYGPSNRNESGSAKEARAKVDPVTWKRRDAALAPLHDIDQAEIDLLKFSASFAADPHAVLKPDPRVSRVPFDTDATLLELTRVNTVPLQMKPVASTLNAPVARAHRLPIRLTLGSAKSIEQAANTVLPPQSHDLELVGHPKRAALSSANVGPHPDESVTGDAVVSTTKHVRFNDNVVTHMVPPFRVGTQQQQQQSQQQQSSTQPQPQLWWQNVWFWVLVLIAAVLIVLFVPPLVSTLSGTSIYSQGSVTT